MKTAVIYARYSSNSQSEQSIEGQLTVCNKFAQDNNIAIVKHYIDRAMTGTNDNRVEFQQMLKDSETANWDIVLVYAIDRFGRNSIEVALNKQKLKKNNKTLISATQRTSENIDGTKNLDGILLENVYIGIAEYYSAELAQKIMRGQRESRRKGNFCGGSIPYGYKVVNKKIVIDDEKAEVVRYIFAQYSLGKTVPQIINELTSNGILHRNKPFYNTAMYAILRNQKYTGVYKLRDEVIDNMYPRIITDEVFETVQKRLEKNKSGKKPYVVYLFRNKLKCGYCGQPISAECGKIRTGEVIRYYKCHGKKKYKSNCPKTAVRKEELEETLLKAIMEMLQTDSIMDMIVDGVINEYNKNDEVNTKVAHLQAELKQVEISLTNVMLAIERGIISNTTNKRLHELEQRQQDLQTQITIEQGKTHLELTREQVRGFYAKALELEPLLLINSVVKEITLFNDKIIITYNNPTNNGSDFDSQGRLFYSKTVTLKSITNYKPVPQYNRVTIEMAV